MGFVRQSIAKITGADVQADAAERGAEAQAQATRAAAQSASLAANEQAAQASRAMETQAARSAATAAASDAAATPVENPDVNIENTGRASASGVARARRAKFGTGTIGGVSI